MTVHESPAGVVHITPESSSGASDGSMGVQITGGTAPYTYLWSNGETTSSITNLATGNYTLVVTDANGCTYERSVLHLNTTGIGESKLLPVEIHPNPAQENLIVQMGSTINIHEINIHVWDMIGRNVLNAQPNQNTFNIEVHGFAPGVYSLHITSGDQSRILKFVKN